MRIVVVEDDTLVGKYLKYVLESQGHYDVVVTESGDEAVALANDASTAALILDVSLRNTQLDGRAVDGLELSLTIKSNPATSRVPVILATAHTMAGDRERFLRESLANGFIRKPFTDSTEVLSLIAQLVADAER